MSPLALMPLPPAPVLVSEREPEVTVSCPPVFNAAELEISLSVVSKMAFPRVFAVRLAPDTTIVLSALMPFAASPVDVMLTVPPSKKAKPF